MAYIYEHRPTCHSDREESCIFCVENNNVPREVWLKKLEEENDWIEISKEEHDSAL